MVMTRMMLIKRWMLESEQYLSKVTMLFTGSKLSGVL